MKKRAISLILIFLLSLNLFAISAGAESPSLSFTLGSATGFAGDQVSLPLTVVGSDKADTYAISSFVYDANALEFVGFSNVGEVCNNALFKLLDKNMGSVVFLYSPAQVINGNVCDIVFNIKSDAPAGNYEVNYEATAKLGDDYLKAIQMNPGMIHVESSHVHDYQAVVVSPTCTTEGFTTYTCECGDSYTDDFVPALGHTPVVVSGYAATCTEPGLTDGSKCAVCDTILTAQEELAALGHSYSGVAHWEWVYGANGYEVNATCKCNACNDGEITVPATVTVSDETEGYITYNAFITLNDKQYSTMKIDKASCSLSITGGAITSGKKADGLYSYNDLITIQADAPAEGKYFAGWYLNGEKVSGSSTYKFYIKNDTELVAHYEDDSSAIQPLVSLEITDRVAVGGGKQQLKLIARWELPFGYQPVKVGIVRTYAEEQPRILTLDQVDGSNIKNSSVAAIQNTGSYTLNLSLSAASAAKDLYAVAYMECINAAGEHKTIYTSIALSAAE